MARLEGGEAAGFELAPGAMARLEGQARFDPAAKAMASLIRPPGLWRGWRDAARVDPATARLDSAASAIGLPLRGRRLHHAPPVLDASAARPQEHHRPGTRFPPRRPAQRRVVPREDQGASGALLLRIVKAGHRGGFGGGRGRGTAVGGDADAAQRGGGGFFGVVPFVGVGGDALEDGAGDATSQIGVAVVGVVVAVVGFGNAVAGVGAGARALQQMETSQRSAYRLSHGIWGPIPTIADLPLNVSPSGRKI